MGQTTKWFVSIGLVFGLSGCGFHLRGSVQLPAVMAHTYVIAERMPELEREVREQLLEVGSQPQSSTLGATAILLIQSESRGRRTLSVNSAGQASSYELSYRLTFMLKDRQQTPLLNSQTISQRQELSLQGANILGASSEEEQIYNELRHRVVNDMLKRIQYGLK